MWYDIEPLILFLNEGCAFVYCGGVEAADPDLTKADIAGADTAFTSRFVPGLGSLWCCFCKLSWHCKFCDFFFINLLIVYFLAFRSAF